MRIPWRSLHRSALPTATASLLAVSLAGFAVSLGTGMAGNSQAETLQKWVGLTSGGLGEGRWWGMVTYLFLPGRVPWLLLVVLPILFLAGRHLEAIVGRRHLTALFLAAGVVGGAAQKAAGGLQGAPDETLAGPGLGVLAVFIALACAAPELDLVPPLSLSAGGAGGRLRVRHGALALVLGAATITVTGGALGAFAGRRESSFGPAAGILAAVVVSCLYMRGLGFGRRTG